MIRLPLLYYIQVNLHKEHCENDKSVYTVDEFVTASLFESNSPPLNVTKAIGKKSNKKLNLSLSLS